MVTVSLRAILSRPRRCKTSATVTRRSPAIRWTGRSSLDLPEGTHAAYQIIVLATWALFVLDYLARLLLAGNRGRYFVRHLIDLR